MTLINYLRWLTNRSTVEKNILRFCELEYRPDDVPHAYQTAINSYKQEMLKGARHV